MESTSEIAFVPERTINVVIPSMSRFDKPCITHRYIKNAILCVPESQLDAYKRVNPNAEIVTHPDTIIGLGAKRNWIMDEFKDVMMLDDDLKGIKKNTASIGERPETLSPSQAWEVIQMLGNMANMLDVKMFGFGNCTNPSMYCPNKPFGLTGFILGGNMGMLENEILRCDTSRIQIKHDYYLSALNAYYFRKCLIDFRYCIGMDGVGKTAGGLQKFRNPEIEYEDSITLRKMFGEAIIPKKAGFSRLKNKYGRTLHVPF
jgi:hypothetical protein